MAQITQETLLNLQYRNCKLQIAQTDNTEILDNLVSFYNITYIVYAVHTK